MRKIFFLLAFFPMTQVFSQENIPNPFAKIGINEEVTTIPNHSDFYNNNDKLELYGLVYDRTTGKVIEVKKYFQDTLMLRRIGRIKIIDDLTCEEEEVNIDTTEFYTYNVNGVSRWLSVDPVMHPYESPFVSFENRPIACGDPDGAEVIWYSLLRNNEQFKTIIQNFTNTDAFKQVFKRFIANQDNVTFTKMALYNPDGSQKDFYGYSGADRTAAGYTIQINSYYFVNGKLAMDATYLVKVMLHEGTHKKWSLASSSEGSKNYPTLKKNELVDFGESDHLTMAEGDVQLFKNGMKQYDAQAGTSHSEDWYTAMSWRGSLQGMDAYNNLANKGTLDKIINNESAYEDYVKAKLTYEGNKTKGNKLTMDNSLKNVDQKLFNQTRNRKEDAKVE